VIRLLPDKQGYEVPVDGEWVTIAVVAERGPINHTRAPVGLEREEEDVMGQNGKPLPGRSNTRKGKASGDAPPKPLGKKYVNLKLIDFGCRSDSGANGGKPVIRGDAFLSLLLFESDSFDTLDTNSGGLPKKIYKGGSKGAFEHMSKLREGAVIALLTPKILKPFQVGRSLNATFNATDAENTTTAFGQHASPHNEHPCGNSRVGGVHFRHWVCKGPWGLPGSQEGRKIMRQLGR